MIFSLGDQEKNIELPARKDVDLFCFFRVKNALTCPPDFWYLAITSSLKAKQPVLILEEGVQAFPHWDPGQRWTVGEHWCWITPRSLGIIMRAYKHSFFTFQEFKAFLKSAK